MQPDYVQLFTFVGKLVGKALWDQQLINCFFVKAFYKMMLGMPLDQTDVEDYDAELYKSMNWFLENPNV